MADFLKLIGLRSGGREEPESYNIMEFRKKNNVLRHNKESVTYNAVERTRGSITDKILLS